MNEANKAMRIGGRVLMMWLAVNTLTIASAQTPSPSPPAATVATPRDGQHDFDFEIGTWRTHLRRRLKPLTGSNEWIEMEGITTVRKVWNGRANLVELVADGAGRHFEGLSLRLYHPEARQWNLHFSNAANGEMAVPTVGEFRNGRGEFYSQESYNGRTILVRFVISDIKADSVRFEQAFSDDYGKTWEVNWIATDTRVNERDDEGPPAAGAAGPGPRLLAQPPRHISRILAGLWRGGWANQWGLGPVAPAAGGPRSSPFR